MPQTRHFLIAEDEAMIAMLLEDFLDMLGHKVIASVANVAEGLRAIAAGGFDAAILDMNLDREKSLPLAEALSDKGIPFLFSSGGGSDSIPPHLGHVPTLPKPFSLAALEAALAAFD